MVITKKVALITAVHIQPSQKWIDSLPNHIPVFIVDDSNGLVKIDKQNVMMFDYKAQEEELGENYQYFADNFHKSSACKNFGLWYAYKQGFDYVIMIDSDCVIDNLDFIDGHIKAIERGAYGWENTLQYAKKEMWPRGYPYGERKKEIFLNLGLWTGLVDIGGQDRIDNRELELNYSADEIWIVPYLTKVAHGIVPLSGMNVCIKREAIPAYFLLPNFADYRRHDDIMGGYIFQKIMKKMDHCLTYGKPFVFHDSPIDSEADAKEEAAMMGTDEEFYFIVDRAIEKVRSISSYWAIFNELSEILQMDLRDTVFNPLVPSLEWYSKIYV